MQPHDTTHPTFIELPHRAKNIAGQRFSRLVAIAPIRQDKQKQVFWYCRCDCGNTTIANASHLGRGNIQSCGCLRAISNIATKTKHGFKSSPLYNTWSNMLKRCTQPTNSQYKNYGGRGITICDEWRNDIKAFIDYVSQLPDYGKPRYSLDRIDNNGNYEPGNVRWATIAEQSHNTRVVKLITYNGETKCIAEWARGIGICQESLRERIERGWSLEWALTTPAHGRKRNSSFAKP